MRLNSLSVGNFRGFAERRFQFHPEFNLLIGENGSGKTSVLEAAAIAIAAWLLPFPNTDSRHIRAKDVRRLSEDIEGRYRELPQFPVRVEAEGVIMDVCDHGRLSETIVRWERSLNGTRGKTTQAGAHDLKIAAQDFAFRTLRQDPVILPIVRYFGAGRLWESVRSTEGMKLSKVKLADKVDALEQSFKDLASPFFGYRLSVDKRCNPADLLNWMATERLIEQDEERPSIALQTVYGAIRSMMPELRSAHYNFRLGTLLLTRRDGTVTRFSDLSDGYRNVIAVAADLAIRCVMLNPRLGENAAKETPGVVLIDEIDLHLHPKWQQRIVDDLRRTFPQLQFICTTHSPFVVQSLRSGEELIALDGMSPAQVNNMPIGEVAEGVMQVPETETSARYDEMKQTATEYMQALQDAPMEPGARLENFKQRLAEKISPYADNPAYQAFLEMKLLAKTGGR